LRGRATRFVTPEGVQAAKALQSGQRSLSGGLEGLRATKSPCAVSHETNELHLLKSLHADERAGCNPLRTVPIASLMEPGFDGIATIMAPPDRQGRGAISRRLAG
jgi:hypothetical protein